MPQYAYFDHTQPEPQHVLGWYDTDIVDYKDKLPKPDDLLELNANQWARRLIGHWAVKGGGLIPYDPRPAPGVGG
jgi:hypothetical protein